MRKMFFTLVILAGCLVLPSYVSAHILKTDGSIGAVLHIDPEDDPIIGEQSAFFFELKDTQNKFKPEDCECIFMILQNGRALYSANALPTTGGVSSSFTFTEKNIYQVQLVGKPKTPDTFQPFTLSYDLRVERISSQQAPKTSQSKTQEWISKHTIHLIVAFAILLFVVIVGIQQQAVKQR